ncbi:hypothetical protein C2G38_2039216 [Gigaspora rosea]|uniref:Uncharacterized protein n=1 Tax=Gigaspora rosea TaxID=44941 RepID=A0A397V0W2_9GLOM|nr:hypothetical protein C2G38_2039216 [Gigaspora rosea]
MEKQEKKKKKEVLKYKLAVLNEEVDLMFLSTGYSTSVPPSQGLCDNCFESLSEKGANNITEKDGIEEFQDFEESEEDMEEHKFIQKRDKRNVLKLQNALEYVDKW